MNIQFAPRPTNPLLAYRTAAPAITPSFRPDGRLPWPQPVAANPLSANELLDVELGLYLLSQLLPTASPDALPSLLGSTDAPFLERPTFTPRQHKILNKGRALLSHIQQKSHLWAGLLEQYIAASDYVQAYDIASDGSRFREKTVGFSRNRIFTLKQMVG
jgi:pPIWI RE three-gene island domain Z